MLLGQVGTSLTHALFLVLHRFFRAHQQILHAPVLCLFGTNGDFQTDHKRSKTSQRQHCTAGMISRFRWKKDIFQFCVHVSQVYTKWMFLVLHNRVTIWQPAFLGKKIQLKLFKILSKIIKTGIKITTQEIFWNLVAARKKRKTKKKEWSLPCVQDSKGDNKNLLCLVFSNFCDSCLYTSSLM